MKAFSLYFVFLDEMEATIRMRTSKRRWSGVEWRREMGLRSLYFLLVLETKPEPMHPSCILWIVRMKNSGH